MRHTVSRRALVLAVAGLAGLVIAALYAGRAGWSEKMNFHPFDPGWLDDVSMAVLAYSHAHGTLPPANPGLRSLLRSANDGRSTGNVSAFYLSDPETIVDVDGQPLTYQPFADGRSFRIISRGRDGRQDTEDDFVVRGYIARQGLVVMAVTRGERTTYRPLAEAVFLSICEQRLLPALERFFDDMGRYPCIDEWRDYAILQNVGDAICRDPTCSVNRRSAARSRDEVLDAAGRGWNGPYLEGVDVPACTRGPFEDPLSYCELAQGMGLSIYADGPDDLMQLEGSLNVVRLRFEE